MLLESALAELSSPQTPARHVKGSPPFSSSFDPCRDPGSHFLSTETHEYADVANSTREELGIPPFPPIFSQSEKTPQIGDHGHPRGSRPLNSLTRQVESIGFMLPDGESIDRVFYQPQSSNMGDERSAVLIDGSPSSSPCPEASNLLTSDTENIDGSSASPQKSIVIEKQISIDPHSISYRGMSSSWVTGIGDLDADEGPAATTSEIRLTRNVRYDVPVAPHSPRSISFPSVSRRYMQGRFSVPDLDQATPITGNFISDYSSERSTAYSIAESPISTLQLHRSPPNVLTPSPPEHHCYEPLYLAPPPAPSPRYRSFSFGGRAARNLFSGPLPRLRPSSSHKKTMSFQATDHIDHALKYGAEGSFRAAATDFMERSGTLQKNLDENVLFKRQLSLKPDGYEDPRSSTVNMSCCTFIQFFGCAKPKLSNRSLQKQRSAAPVPQRIPSHRSLHEAVAIDRGDEHFLNTRNFSADQLSSSSEEDTIFREPSFVMESPHRRASTSTGHIYTGANKNDEIGDFDAVHSHDEFTKPERAAEVLLSNDEAYFPVASAFMFGENDNPASTTRNTGIPVVSKIVEEGNNGDEASGTKPALRRVRFNLESTEVMEQDDGGSLVSSSASSSREIFDMRSSMGPFVLTRSTTKRGWDDPFIMAEGTAYDYRSTTPSILTSKIGNLSIDHGLPGQVGNNSFRDGFKREIHSTQ